MQFLKTALWVVIAVAIALFIRANWDVYQLSEGRVAINLWGEPKLYVRLPAIVLVSFLAGLVPTWIMGRISRWTLHKRAEQAESRLATLTSTLAAASAEATARPLPTEEPRHMDTLP